MKQQEQSDQQWFIIPERQNHGLVFFPEKEVDKPCWETILAWRFNVNGGIPNPLTLTGVIRDDDDVWCVQQPIDDEVLLGDPHHARGVFKTGWRYVFLDGNPEGSYLTYEEAIAYARTKWAKRRGLSLVPA